MEEPHRTFDLGTAIRAIRQRIALVLAATVLMALGGLALAATQDEVFTASTTVLAQDAGFDQQAFGTETVVLQTDALGPFTEAELGSLNTVAARTSRILGGEPGPGEIEDAVEVEPDPDAGVISVEAESPTADGAAALANSYAEAMIEVRRQMLIATIEDARQVAESRLKTLEPDSQSAKRLEEQLDRLATFEDLQTGDLVKVNSAVAPADPTRPKPILSAFAGGIAGLLIGIALALILERARPRLGSARDAERALGLPVIAEVGTGHGQTVGEAVRMLRTRLLSGRGDEPLRSILILPVDREPAARLASELADSAAAAGLRTLLIDANLRTEGEAGRPSLSEVLTGAGSAPTRTPEAGGERAARIGPGGPVEDPAAVLGRPSMRALIESAVGDHDLVVLSAPSPVRHPDAIPLLDLVDDVVIAVEPGADERCCSDLSRLLQDLQTRPSGAVLLGRRLG